MKHWKTIAMLLMICFPLASFAELVVEEEIIPATEADSVETANSDEYASEEYYEEAPAPKRKIKRRRVVRRTSKKPSLENRLDRKMEKTRSKLEDKLAEAIDSIEINVGGQSKKAEESEYPETVKAEPQTVEPMTPVASPTVSNAFTIDANQNQSTATVDLDEEEKSDIAIYPLFGITNMSSDSAYDVDGKFSAGIGLEGAVTPNITIGASYTYSKFDIPINNGSGYYYDNNRFWYGNRYRSFNNISSEDFNKLEYGHNLIDIGMKYLIGSPSSRIRPYLGAGLGYSFGYLNHTQEFIDWYNNNGYHQLPGQLDDYETSAFLGFLQAGLDFKLGKNFAAGLNLKYHNVFSSSGESSQSNDVYGNGPFFGPRAIVNRTNYNFVKDQVGASLRENSFYSALLNIKLIF